MGKLPWTKWYPRDWLGDPNLRTVSVAARGAWIDALSAMMDHGTFKVSFSLDGWSRFWGVSEDVATGLIEELLAFGVCEIDEMADVTFASPVTLRDKNVTLVSRRRQRESKALHNHRLRQKRYRDSRKSDGNVTGEKSDIRYQKADNPPLTPPLKGVEKDCVSNETLVVSNETTPISPKPKSISIRQPQKIPDGATWKDGSPIHPDDLADMRKPLLDQFVDYWNTLARPDTDSGWPGPIQIRSMNKSREQKLKARMQERFWREHWREALAKVGESTFCCGGIPPRDGHKLFRAHVDWFLRPGTLAKVIDGLYDDSTEGSDDDE